MDEKQIDSLLRDVKIDKERVKKSIYAVLDMYHISLKDIFVYRKRLNPEKIFVSAVEECNLDDAKKIMEEKYSNILPAPITVLEFKQKYFLFMGSARGVIFVLKGETPDCIVVKIPDNTKEPVIVSEARRTLKEIIDEQKDTKN